MIDVPIMLDGVENLAGIKIVIQYNKDLLLYKESRRAEQTSSLMHIVNDTKPGVLIIVMAGAKGISGKNFPIFFLRFQISNFLKNQEKVELVISEVQLVSDQLKNIEHTVSVQPLVLDP